MAKQSRVLFAAKEHWEQEPAGGAREQAKFDALMRHPEFYKDCAFVAALDSEDHETQEWRKVFVSPQFDDENWENLDHYAILDHEYETLDEEKSPDGKLLGGGHDSGFYKQISEGCYIFPYEEPEQQPEPTGRTEQQPDELVVDGSRVIFDFNGKYKGTATVRTRDGCGDALLPANKVMVIADTGGWWELIKPEDLISLIEEGECSRLECSDDPTEPAERAAVLVREGHNVIGALFGAMPMESMQYKENALTCRMDMFVGARSTHRTRTLRRCARPPALTLDPPSPAPRQAVS